MLANKILGAAPGGRAPRRPYNPYDEEKLARAPGHAGIQDQPDEGYGDIREPDPDYDFRRVVGVPEPDMLKAVGIVLVVGVLMAIVNFVIDMGFGASAAGLDGPQRQVDLMAALLAAAVKLPVDFLLQTGLFTAMLPTSFGKAALVSLMQFLIVLAIGAVIVVIAMGVVALLDR